MKHARGRRGRWWHLPAKILLLVVGLELLSYAGLRVAAPRLNLQTARLAALYRSQSESLRRLLEDPSTLLAYDRQLGWKPRAGASTPTDAINAQGLRSRREYAPEPPPGTLRLAVFGDSFAYCTEVADDQAWPRILELRDPRLEVLNHGVPAYGPDQAYLRLVADGTSLHPHAALLCLTEVSLERVVNVCRTFLARTGTEGFWVKPRYEFRGERLELLPNPFHLEDAALYLEHPEEVRRFGTHDYWYDPWIFENPLYDRSAAVRLGACLWNKVRKRYLDSDRPLIGPPDTGRFNPDSSAFRILLELVHRFTARSREHGAAPLVVILPDRFSLQRSRAGTPPVHAPLAERLSRDGVAFVDATEAFQRHADDPLDEWFMPLGHYSPAANRILADWLSNRLPEPDLPR